MLLNIEQLGVIANELTKFEDDLRLSPEQRQILHDLLRRAFEHIEEYKRQNPHLSAEDLVQRVADSRAIVRRRIAHFLNGEQIGKWDAKTAKDHKFLGLKIAA